MEIFLKTPEDGETLPLLRPEHIAYIKNPTPASVSDIDWLHLEKQSLDLSYPLDFAFTYEPKCDAKIIVQPVGEADDLRPMVFEGKNGQAVVWNLMIGTEYEWYAEAYGEKSEKRRFFTSPQFPRMLYVDGITNVRDFGGFRTADGKIIRQHRIYRTSEMDNHAVITEEGKKTFYDLGIKTDVDFREEGARKVVLDKSRVRWVNFPLSAYNKIFCDEQKRLYKESFEMLTDESVYPLICHCWGGIDRTGTWLFILGNLLGVPADDLMLDYELSSFSRWGKRSRTSDLFTGLLNGLYAYDCDIRTACVNFLLDCGLTSETLEKIRKMLLKPLL